MTEILQVAGPFLLWAGITLIMAGISAGLIAAAVQMDILEKGPHLGLAGWMLVYLTVMLLILLGVLTLASEVFGPEMVGW